MDAMFVGTEGLIYYPDHAQRYAHMGKRERWRYPDEVHLDGILPIIIKRVKLFKDLTAEDVRGIAGYIPCCIMARDVPIDEVYS